MYWLTEMGLTKEQLTRPILKSSRKRKMKFERDASLTDKKTYYAKVINDPLLEDKVALHSDSELDDE